jgi:hypothetical protein
MSAVLKTMLRWMRRRGARPGPFSKTDVELRKSGCHRTDERIEADIFVAFLFYRLQATLKQRLRSLV